MEVQIALLNVPFLGSLNHVNIQSQIPIDMSDTTPQKTSLDLLLNQAARPSWSPAWTTSASWLEERSTTILQNLAPPNNKNPGHSMIDHYHIAEFPSDGSLAKSTKSVQLYGRDNYMRFRAKLVAANPGLTLEVVDTTSKLDDTAGKATVCVTCRLLHYEHIDMKPRESVVFMDWVRRKGDNWVCVKSKVMHGHSHLPAFPAQNRAEEEATPATAGPSSQEPTEKLPTELDTEHVSDLEES